MVLALPFVVFEEIISIRSRNPGKEICDELKLT